MNLMVLTKNKKSIFTYKMIKTTISVIQMNNKEKWKKKEKGKKPKKEKKSRKNKRKNNKKKKKLTKNKKVELLEN